MNREELKTILPHREPMLLLDEAERIEEEAVGRYTVRGDEYFLQGHFPGNPIVPGVIMCEILAQSVCVLLQDKMEEDPGIVPMYTGMNNVKFRNSAKPGDTIVTKCTITRSKYPFYFAKGKAFVGDTVCAEADFSFVLAGEK